MSSDRDWFPEWLGLSGRKIKPELCLTIGVSGAVQHVVGIRDSRVIAAVNNDENAAIFTQADIGVVADLERVRASAHGTAQVKRCTPGLALGRGRLTSVDDRSHEEET